MSQQVQLDLTAVDPILTVLSKNAGAVLGENKFCNDPLLCWSLIMIQFNLRALAQNSTGRGCSSDPSVK